MICFQFEKKIKMSIRISENEMNVLLRKNVFVERTNYEDAFYFIYPNFYLRKRYDAGLKMRENHVLMHLKGISIIEVEGEENIYTYLRENGIPYIYLEVGIFKMRKSFERIANDNMFIDVFPDKILATSISDFISDYTPEPDFFSFFDERKKLSVEEEFELELFNSGTYSDLLFQRNLLKERKYDMEESNWKEYMSDLSTHRICHPDHDLYKKLIRTLRADVRREI
jgi:hypothetical protein